MLYPSEKSNTGGKAREDKGQTYQMKADKLEAEALGSADGQF
jgi:hypothetical protein